MAYHFYLGEMLCPVAPSQLQLKIGNNNKTMTLINEGEVNILKQAGLTDVSFDLLLPNVKYPFAVYEDNDGDETEDFKKAGFYLEKLEKMKTDEKPFQFIVTRVLPNEEMLFDTNMKVSLESYDIKEDAEQGFDVVVSIKLKQYKEYGVKTCTVTIKKDNKTTATVTKKRTTEKSPAPSKNKNKTHTVKKGDCLWNIAKKYYGDGSKWKKIYNANKNVIEKAAKKHGKKSSSNGHWIYPGTKLTIPAL